MVVVAKFTDFAFCACWCADIFVECGSDTIIIEKHAGLESRFVTIDTIGQSDSRMFTSLVTPAKSSFGVNSKF
jgi:hypothetical protein